MCFEFISTVFFSLSQPTTCILFNFISKKYLNLDSKLQYLQGFERFLVVIGI